MNPSQRLPGLDLLRALAVAWVMLFHSFLVGGLGPDWSWLSRFGWAGVDVFFVLSGYLIGTQTLQRLQRGEFTFGAFYARRARRILPAFFVVLALYALVPGLREEPGLQPWWQFATFTVNLLIDYDRNRAFSHAWSLCVEEHFYLVFPLLAWALWRKATVPRFVFACVLVLLFGIAVRGATWMHWTALDSPRNWYIELIYYPTWARLDGLLVGVMLAALRVHRTAWWERWQRRSNAVLAGGLVLCVVAFLCFRDRTGFVANTIGWPLLSLAFGALVFAGAGTTSAIGRWRVPGAAWVAAISYSLYLSHKIAIHVVQVAVAPVVGVSGYPLFGVYAVAVLLLGAALHYAVERPFLGWGADGSPRRPCAFSL